MTYELAKQLKDAGFPQKSPLHEPPYGYELSADDQALGIVVPPVVYFPTIEELIEACGDSFTKLFRVHPRDQGDKWGAGNEYFFHIGSIPSEAVAKLWLAINKE